MSGLGVAQGPPAKPLRGRFCSRAEHSEAQTVNQVNEVQLKWVEGF